MPIGSGDVACSTAGCRTRGSAASRPCSMPVAARLGKPMTSPAAKIVRDVVRYSSSTSSRPRLSAARPAAARSSVVGRPLPAGRVQHHVGGDPLAALEQHHACRCSLRSTADTVSPNRNTTPRSRRLVLQRLDDLVVAELEQAVPRSTTVTRVPQCGEHRRVLDPDHARTDDHERAGNPVEVQDPVGVQDQSVRRTPRSGRPARASCRRRSPRAPVSRRSMPSSAVTARVCGVDEPCRPVTSSTRLRASWSRITSISCSMTCCARQSRSCDRDLLLDADSSARRASAASSPSDAGRPRAGSSTGWCRC